MIVEALRQDEPKPLAFDDYDMPARREKWERTYARRVALFKRILDDVDPSTTVAEMLRELEEELTNLKQVD